MPPHDGHFPPRLRVIEGGKARSRKSKDDKTDFFEKYKGVFWVALETRPYMRARAAYRLARTAHMKALQIALLFLFCAELVAADATLPVRRFPLWDSHETVEQYAQRTNLPATKTLDLGNGVKLELVLIPAGKFVMGTPEPIPVDEEGFHKQIVTGQALLALGGSILLVLLCAVAVQAMRKRQRPKFSLARLLAMTVAAGVAVLSWMHWQQTAQLFQKEIAEYWAVKARYDNSFPKEKPAHAVTLTRPFYMGKYTVTQEQYQQVAGTNPSNFKGNGYPVEQVSWSEAQKFCMKLSEKADQGFRLPTEAEWEYACRAGTSTTHHSGDTEKDLARVAWYGANSKNKMHPVGQKEPNAFGLYDMHGNVWQWCQDWYEEGYYAKSPPEDPEGPAQGDSRVWRGGSWCDAAQGACRTTARMGDFPFNRSYGVGFRVVVPASRTP